MGGGKAAILHLLDAHKHSGFRGSTCSCSPHKGAMLQQRPAGLQQQALLRVHQLGFCPGDAEERGIKLVHVSQEPAVASTRL